MPLKYLSLFLFLILASVASSTEVAFAKSHNTTYETTNKKENERPKIGLALGGGGARGAAHVGVLRMLDRQGIQIDYIAGTNVGAVVGGLYAAGVSVDSIEKMFTKRSLMKAYLTVPIKVRILVIPLFSLPRMLGRKSLDGLYRGGRFKKFLNKYVPESERDLKDLKIPFGAVAFDLIDGRPETLKEGNLGAVLQASSATPVLRKPVRLNDGLYVDGGVSVNLPVKEVRAMGADIVIAVNLNKEKKRKKEIEQFYKVGSVSHRIITLHLNSIDKNQLQKADLVIEPEVENIGLTSSSSKDAKKAIQSGEAATMAKLDEINKLLNKP